MFIVEVFPDGAAHKDGRLQAGDQILEICSQSFKEIEHEEAHAAVLKVSGTVRVIWHNFYNFTFLPSFLSFFLIILIKIFKIFVIIFLSFIHFESLVRRSRWWCIDKRKERKKSRSNCRRSREKGLVFAWRDTKVGKGHMYRTWYVSSNFSPWIFFNQPARGEFPFHNSYRSPSCLVVAPWKVEKSAKAIEWWQSVARMFAKLR